MYPNRRSCSFFDTGKMCDKNSIKMKTCSCAKMPRLTNLVLQMKENMFDLDAPQEMSHLDVKGDLFNHFQVRDFNLCYC